jgi:hypothetical protein
MVIGTCKSNAAKHPGRLLTDSRQQRWTRRQMEEDKARTKAAVIAAEEDANAKHQAIVKHVVDIEDSLEQDKEVIQTYTNRPNLRNSSKYPVAEKPADLE